MRLPLALPFKPGLVVFNHGRNSSLVNKETLREYAQGLEKLLGRFASLKTRQK
jgi:hypothetical protein